MVLPAGWTITGAAAFADQGRRHDWRGPGVQGTGRSRPAAGSSRCGMPPATRAEAARAPRRGALPPATACVRRRQGPADEGVGRDPVAVGRGVVWPWPRRRSPSSGRAGRPEMGHDAASRAGSGTLLAGRPDVEEKRMVGGMSFVVGGHLCVGVKGDALLVRVGPAAYGGPRRTRRPPARVRRQAPDRLRAGRAGGHRSDDRCAGGSIAGSRSWLRSRRREPARPARPRASPGRPSCCRPGP